MSINPRSCHSEEYPKGTCFAARSGVGIRSQRGTAALTGRRGRRPLRNGSPRCAQVEAASSTLPAAFQKENTILTDGVSFWSGRRGSTRYRHPTNGRAIRGSPAFTSGFDALRAGRGSEFHPARGIPKRKTTQRVVFLYFSRSAQQNRRGSNSLPGIPRMAEPFAGALPPPLDLTRFAPVEAASSILPAAFQKEKPPKGWFFFLERATRLELATSTLARSRSTR